jgi:tight adherence protein B
MALLWAGLTFLAIVALVGGVAFALAGRGHAEVVRRIDTITRAESRNTASADLELARDEMLSGVPLLNRLLQRWSWSRGLKAYLAQAGWKIKPGKLLLTTLVLGFGSYVIAAGFSRSVPIALVIGIVCGSIPFVIANVKRQRRLRAFQKNFPEAIDLLVRAVRAGHAFTTGLEMIGNELPPPISEEFRTTFDEHNFGLPLRDALWHLAERVPLIDVRFFVSALMIQKETGGNLAEILENLAQVIRERFKILGEVRVRTAQGRLTALILISVPPSLLAFLASTNPDYVRVLWTDPWGIKLLIGAVVLQVIGSFLLWKIVNIEV